jgi:hypothetical protein
MDMTAYNKLIRPGALIEGSEYLRQEKLGGREKLRAGENTLMAPVTFVAYHPCPAFVIVVSGERKVCCPREELFLPVV